MNLEEFNNLIRKLNNTTISTYEKNLLLPYHVDNAIIMAAGKSSRCLPLSELLPKGLFKVNGEVLIERQIRQLQSAGVSNIIIVTGYKAEMFEYLKPKYGVTIVLNNEYEKRNNTSSIYAVRKYLGNSYICCADNYYSENIFSEYEYDSFYTCNYTQKYADEYCITENEKGYIESIIRGGEKQWYTIGANYWSRKFSAKFIELLENEYNNPEIYNLLIDDFHIRHLSELPMLSKKHKDGVVYEFDTLEEFENFDKDFKTYKKELIADNLYGKYNGVTRYAGVKTEIKTGRLHFNENLWGPSPNALKPLRNASLEDLYLYDSLETDELCLEISKKYDIPYENIFLHNSGSEMVRSIFSIMIGENDKVLLPLPHWSYYPGVVDYRFGTKLFYHFCEDGDKCYHNINEILKIAEEHKPKIIIVTTPAMPSGNLISPEDLEKIIKLNPMSLIFVDQAYYGFENDSIDVNYFVKNYDNVVFVRTFSKFFALAGLRLGYAVSSARALKALWLDLPLLRLPVISRKSVIECLKDDEYYDDIRLKIHNAREWLYNELKTLQCIHPYKSDTNFIYMKLSNIDGIALRERMISKGYIFRIFEYEGNQYYRINVAPMEIMQDFMKEFRDTINEMKQ